MSTLDIYDLQLDDLADLADDFEASTHAGVENWVKAQWQRTANVLGFRESFDRLARGRRRSRDYSTSAVGLRAFYAYLTRLDGATEPDLARIRHQSLTALRRIDPANLWITDIDSRRLPESACFDAPGQVVRDERPGPIEQLLFSTAPAVQVMPRKRVFKSDVSASYFHPKDKQDPAGKPRDVGPCIYRVRLSLGTFPFVYGDNLADPTGLYWYSHKDWRPALEAMRIASRFWTQEGNLAQDARTVLRQYKHFRITTARILNRRLPGGRDARTGVLRPANKRKRVAAPRGPIHVNAYNSVLYSFAAFFAARRAYLRAPRALSPETWRAVKANPDPVLHEQLGLKKRAM